MSKTNLAKNTILLSLGTILTNVLQFVMVPLFSSWLTASDYGTFDLCVTYVSLLLPVINLASGEAVFRFSIDEDITGKRSYISNGLAIVIINATLVSLVLSLIGLISGHYILFPFVCLLIGQLLNSYCQSFLRGIKKLNIYSLGNAITTLFISISVTILVRFFSMGLYGIIIGYSIGYLLGDLFIFTLSGFVGYFSIKEISVQGMKELVKYSYPLIPNNISWWVINASDRMIISFFLGTASNGIFAIAHKIPNVCSSIFGMFNISWQESASEVVNENDRNEYFNFVFNNTTAILISLCTGVLSLNFLLYDYIFDVKYYEAALYTPILICAIIFSSLAQFYGGIMISLKMPKANGSTTMIGAVINLLVHLILINFLGLYAAAISTFVANLSLCIIRKIYLKKEIFCKWNSKVYFYWAVYIYMFVSAYMHLSILVRIINVLLATALFVYINKILISKLIKKILLMKKLKFR